MFGEIAPKIRFPFSANGLITNSFPNVTASSLLTTDSNKILTSTTTSLTPQFSTLGLGATAAAATITSQLNIFSATQNSARIILSGQEFSSAGNTSADGIGFLLGINRSGNKQLWIVNSAAAAVNSTNTVLRLYPNTGGAIIDSIATDGATVLPITFGNSGAATTIAGSVANVSGGVLHIGSVTLDTTTPLAFSATASRKIKLYDDSFSDDNQYHGFGIGSSTVIYQIPDTAHFHMFRAGTSSSTSTNLMQIAGTGLVNIYSKLAIGATQTTNVSYALNLTGADANISGPHIGAYTAADQYPVFQQLNWQHNNIALGFDHFWNGSSWISSSSGSNFQIYKVSNQLQFNYNSGVAAGSTSNLTTAGYIDTSGILNWNKQIKINTTTADSLIVTYTGTAGVGTQLCSFGTGTSERFQFFDELSASSLGPKLNFNAGNPGVFASGGNNVFAFVSGTPSVYPTTDNNTTLGKSGNRWSQLWAGTTTINTSDATTKNNIENTRLGLDFVNKLTPREFKFNERKRVHHGLVAQEVKKVLDDLNINTNDFAGYVDPKFEDPEDTSPCGLRYSEFIAPLISAVQELSNRISFLEMGRAA